MSIRIKEVTPREDFTLRLTFRNNEIGIFDIKPFLDKGDFKRLRDLELFKKVKLVDGVMTWENRIDISPETIYLLSEKMI